LHQYHIPITDPDLNFQTWILPTSLGPDPDPLASLQYIYTGIYYLDPHSCPRLFFRSCWRV